MENMLRRLLGASVDLTLLTGAALGNIKADPGYVEQVVMNLAVNARDAMPDGGQLTVETANAELDEDYAAAHLEVTPGSYVQLSVSDNGVGMDRRDPSPDLRAVLHDQGVGQGHGAGPGNSVWHRQAERRPHLGVQRAWARHDLQALLSQA